MDTELQIKIIEFLEQLSQREQYIPPEKWNYGTTARELLEEFYKQNQESDNAR